MDIPILKLGIDADQRASLHRAVDAILDSGQLSYSQWMRRAEASFSSLHAAPYALAVANCTSGMELLLRAHGITGKEVIVPSNTFAATALAAIHAGNRIRLVDSSFSDFGIDLRDLEQQINSETAAVIAVHIGGLVSGQFAEILELCRKRGLVLIEDCAHAHGSSFKNQPVGTLADGGSFSFFPTKTLVAGEGGMVTTRNSAIAEIVGSLRNHGKDATGGIGRLGHNFKMPEISSALLSIQAEAGPGIFARRRAIAARYDAAIASMQGIYSVAPPPGTTSGYYKYIVATELGIDPKTIKAAMKTVGVSLTGEVYATPLHREPLISNYPDLFPGALRDFPGASAISKRHFCLPLFQALTDPEVDYVIESLGTVLNQI